MRNSIKKKLLKNSRKNLNKKKRYSNRKRINKKKYTKKKGGAQEFLFESDISDRNQLSEIMYNAMTAPGMNTRIKDKHKLMNLDLVDLDESLKIGKIKLKFNFLNDDDIGGSHRYYVRDDNPTGIYTLKETNAGKWADDIDYNKVKARFEDMKCPEDEEISCIRKGDQQGLREEQCDRGRSRYKLFYCAARDLGDYVRQLNKGTISKTHHNRIFEIISKWTKFKNHNMDIPVLHFKA